MSMSIPINEDSELRACSTPIKFHSVNYEALA
jgi:hypothetical protein